MIRPSDAAARIARTLVEVRNRQVDLLDQLVIPIHAINPVIDHAIGHVFTDDVASVGGSKRVASISVASPQLLVRRVHGDSSGERLGREIIDPGIVREIRNYLWRS